VHDPYHPLYISGSSVSRLNDYSVADIIGRHCYWCQLGLPGGGRTLPDCIAACLRWASRNASEPNHRPLFFMPQAEMTSASRRPHTPDERRVTVYLAAIHGAKSILYWVAPIRHRLTAQSMKELSAELKAMAPALLLQPSLSRITVKPTPGEGAPALHADLKTHPDGYNLLIAANASPESLTVTWDLSSLGRAAAVSDFFSGSKQDTEDGTWTDRFAGFATRVYRIDRASLGQHKAVEIRAALSGPAAAPPQTASPVSTSQAAINRLTNPDFTHGMEGWETFTRGQANVTLTPTAQGGARLLIVKRDLDSVASVNCNRLQLKAGKRYRYGGRIRARLDRGDSAGFFRLYHDAPPGTAKRVSSGIPVPSKPADIWLSIVREVDGPPDADCDAVFCFQFSSQATGEVALTDLRVEELAPAPKERPRQARSGNILLNSSFEEAGLPGWPDGWFLDFAEPGHMIGDPRGCGQDSATAFHGAFSLRLVNPKETPSSLVRGRYVHEFASVSRRGGIPVEAGKPYVFSAYMRADKADTPAQVSLMNFVSNSPRGSENAKAVFELSTDWQRYELPVVFPAEGWRIVDRPWLTLWIRNAGTRCTLWVDAIQFEAGEAATPYESSHHR